MNPVEQANYSRELAEHLTEEHGFVCLPTSWKKPLPYSWQTLRKTYTGDLWNESNGTGVVTGRASGITVIDVDPPAVPFFDKFIEHHKIKATTWVVTGSGGYHLYFKFDERLPNGKFRTGVYLDAPHEESEIDIRNEGGQIIAPHSLYYSQKACKKKHNGKRYKFKRGGGKKLNFDHIRDLDDIFVQMYFNGVNRKTMEVGTKKFTMPTRKQEKVLVSDTNQKAFGALMLQYTKQCGGSYEEWLHGVWAICSVAEEYDWDAEELAIKWSEKIKGYDGPEPVKKKVREWNPTRGAFGLDWLIAKVPDCATFNTNFTRTYCYHDYVGIVRNKGNVSLEKVHQYIKTALIRVDRQGCVHWYGRGRVWFPLKETPFSGNSKHTFKLLNPDFDPKKAICDDNKKYKGSSSLHRQIIEHQLDIVPNYKDLQFLPHYSLHDPTPRGVFNTFTGYKHTALSPEEYALSAPTPEFEFVMNHWLETMCGGDQGYYSYLMNWLAFIIQRGYQKVRTAIVMFGEPGLGKDTMWVTFFRDGILGSELGDVVTNMKRFTEKFNMGRLNRSIHIFNECTSVAHGSKVNWDQMKAIVTDKYFTAEPKGKESFNGLDCAGCVLLSNHERPCDLPNDDRRYIVQKLDPKHKGNSAYFKKLNIYVRDSLVQRTFFTFLARRDISAWDMNVIPKTDARVNMKVVKNENCILDYLRQLVCGEYKVRWFDPKQNAEELAPKGHTWYSQQNLFASYDHWLAAEGHHQQYRRRKKGNIEILVKAGLERKAKKTVRDYTGKQEYTGVQKVAWCINKAAVRQAHRTYLEEPNWDYPAALPELTQEIQDEGHRVYRY